MSTTWDDEFLTVAEIAEHLKLNQQTVRNWIDQGELPAVRIGRRVRVRRADLEHMVSEGATRPPAASPPPTGDPGAAREQLAEGLQRAQRLLGRRSAARRTELAEGLQELTATVAAVLEILAAHPGAPSDTDAGPASDDATPDPAADE
jgi:excisionase family DNA binding protein